MCLRKLFCSHKYLTGISAFYYKQTEITKDDYSYISVGYKEPIIELKCDKCGKLIYLPLMDMQQKRHQFEIEVDTTLLEKYEFFGGKEKVKEREKVLKINKEYTLEYKIETKDGHIVQTGFTVDAPTAYMIEQYWERWVEKRIFDFHIFENGKEITKKVNKFLGIEKR